MIKLHTSRWAYWYGYLLIALLLAVFVWSVVVSHFVFSVISIVVALLSLLVFELSCYFSRFELDEDEIVKSDGLLSVKTTRIHFSNISDFAVEQSFIQRFLNIGNLHINTSGTERIEMHAKSLPHLDKVQDFVSKRLHIHRSGGQK